VGQGSKYSNWKHSVEEKGGHYEENIDAYGAGGFSNFILIGESIMGKKLLFFV